MTIALADYERGQRYRKRFCGSYSTDLAELQLRLEQIQVAHIVHGRRAVVMFEGWDAAGKGGIIQRLTAKWDQRNFEVYPIAAPSRAEKKHDFLWRFRRNLPEPGTIAVFDRSWYGRVLVERVEGYASEEEWRRGYDEINAFEAALIEGGTTLVKLFVHITQKEQDKRLRARIEDPWKRWKIGTDDFRNRARRTDYLAAMDEMFVRTDTPVAPWIAIDGNRKKPARITALNAIADALEANVPMAPPALDPAVAALAEDQLGVMIE